MEDLWKKFKEETQESMQKINEFLNETSSDEKSQSNEMIMEISQGPESIPQPMLPQPLPEIPPQVVLDDEKSKISQLVEEMFPAKKSLSNRKKIYGKLRDVVKEIMKKENVSRAQAYRKAKKRILNDKS